MPSSRTRSSSSAFRGSFRFLWTGALLALFLVMPGLVMPAMGDDVYLVNGSLFEGVMAEVSETHVAVELPIGQMKFPRSQVERVVKAESPMATFRERRAELLGDPSSSPERWLELARWAQVSGLERDALKTALLVARLAPALDGLAPMLRSHGFVLDEELGWVRFSESMKRRGLVELEGEWMSPSERHSRIDLQREQIALERERRLASRAVSSDSVAASGGTTRESGGASANDVALEAVRLAREVVAGQTVGQGTYAFGAFPVVIPRLPLSGSFAREVPVAGRTTGRGSGHGAYSPSHLQFDWDVIANRQPGSFIPIRAQRRQVPKR